MTEPAPPDKARPHVTIYTDGGSKPNPGPGGWAAILRCASPAREREISGFEPDTTNNRMELTAVAMALDTLKLPCDVVVVTDSQYLANAFRQGWLEKWKRNGWRTAGKEPVKNQDLWLILDAAIARHRVRWEWTRGHSGHEENERCDVLATEARESRRVYVKER